MKILITGGSGFIGSHLAERLIREGHTVSIFDITTNKHVPSTAVCLEGDITDLGQVTKACKGHDGIVHLAAISRVSTANDHPHACINVNVLGITNILEAVRKAEKQPWVVFGSTRNAARKPIDDCGNNVYDTPNNFYGISKFFAEVVCRQFAHSFNLRILTLRFGDIYGSVRDHNGKVLPIFVKNILINRPLTINNPDQQFNFVFWADLIEGIYKAVNYIKTTVPGFYDECALYSDTYTSISELARLIDEESHNKKQKGDRTTCNLLPEDLRVNLEKSRKILGFSAEVPLRDGIKKYIEDIRPKILEE